MGSERISISRDGGVAHVELAREGKFNAMDKAMFEAIGEAFRTLGADSSVRAILLSGRGRHFTAGLDLQYAASQFPPDRRSGPGGRSAAPAHQMAAGRVQRRRGGAAAGDRRDPRRLHRRRGRSRHRLRHPARRRRRLLPGGRGRRRHHRRSRHAPAAHPSDPGRRGPRARLYRPADGGGGGGPARPGQPGRCRIATR